MTDKMREEFEKWHMERYGGFGLGRSTEPGYTDEYERVGTNLQWEAWQAARTVPEGFVMVPVEPTPEMLKAGERGIGVSSYVRKGMTIREYRFFKSGWDAMLAATQERQA